MTLSFFLYRNQWCKQKHIDLEHRCLFGRHSFRRFSCCLFLITFLYNHRSSPPEVFLEKGVLKICSKFTGEHPCWSVISKKLLCNFIKITLRYEWSPVNLLHIFRTPFTKNISEGQSLYPLILYFCVIRLLGFFFFRAFSVLIPEIRNQKPFITYICTCLIVYFSQFRVFLPFWWHWALSNEPMAA